MTKFTVTLTLVLQIYPPFCTDERARRHHHRTVEDGVGVALVRALI